MRRTTLALPTLVLAACGGAPSSASIPPVRALPDCWQPSPDRPQALERGGAGLLAELRFGQALDALERMIEPHRRDPDRPEWRVASAGAGFEVHRGGRVRADGALALWLEVFDLERSPTRAVERWTATARIEGGRWRYELAEHRSALHGHAPKSGSSGPRLVEWGGERRGCSEDLVFRERAGALECWTSEGAPRPASACRALARLLEGSAGPACRHRLVSRHAKRMR